MNYSVYFMHTEDFLHFYIGKSVDVQRRFTAHRIDMRNGVHHSDLVQSAHDEIGEAAFCFTVAVSGLDEAAATDMEAALLEYHHGRPGCLNVSSTPHTFDCPKLIGQRNETLRGQAHRNAASALAIEFAALNPLRAQAGHKASALTRQSAEWRAASSAWMTEHANKPDVQAAFSLRIRNFYAAGGVNAMSRPVVQVRGDGSEVIHVSAQAAAEATGANNSAIGMTCMGKRKTAGGFNWRYA